MPSWSEFPSALLPLSASSQIATKHPPPPQGDAATAEALPSSPEPENPIELGAEDPAAHGNTEAEREENQPTALDPDAAEAPTKTDAPTNRLASRSTNAATHSTDVVFSIGDGQPYAGFADAIAAIPETDAGNVVFSVTSDLYQDYREYLSHEIAFELPTDRGITSFTITSDADSTITIGNSSDSSYSIRLYTNGIATTIESPVKMNAYLYGGSNGMPLTADSLITIREGAYASSIFGGSLNADLIGSSKIVVEGTAGTVVGGCRAYASDGGLASASATMSGSSNIIIAETGGARTVIGGGIACFPDSGNTTLNASSSLSGSTSITIEGRIDEVYGGGSAGASSIALDGLSNTTATANVMGNTSVVFGAKAQTYSTPSMDKMQVWGGGLATGTESDANRATADVLGCTRITALEDDTAAENQPNAKSFSRFHGGGCAFYRNTQANTGSTEIQTARCGWESAAGIIGGGYANNGGTADVIGATRVEVFGIDGQKPSYENANLIAGGGLAENGSNDDATSAKAGSTEIVVHKGANLISGSSTGMNIVGGGLAKGNNCSTDISDTAHITVDPGANVSMGIVGGGVVWGRGSFPQSVSNASANVGATSITFGSGASVGGLVIGGGYAFSKVENSAANVLGSVEIIVEDGCSFSGNFFVGGGMASAAVDCTTIVNGSITTSFGNAVSTKSFVGGGFSYNGSTGCATDVSGSIATTFGNDYTMPIGQFIGGGYVFYNATACTSTAQSVDTTMGDNANLAKQWMFAAGRVATNSTGDARIGSETNKGDTAVSFRAGQNFSAYVFATGGYIDGDMTGASTVGITGNVEASFAGGDIKFYYGGAYLSSTNGNGAIDGNVESSFSNFTFPANDGTMPNVGSNISGDAKLIFKDTVLNKAYSASTASNIGGSHIVNFVGASKLNDFIYAEHNSGTFLVEIGDGDETPTTTVVSGIYSPNHIGETNVLVHAGATLVPNTTAATNSGEPYHLMGVYNIELEEGGSLLTYNEHPTTIYGSLRGASSTEGTQATATITMPASATLVSDPASGGTLDGSLTVKPTGTMADGMVLFDFAETSTGSVSLDDAASQTRFLAKDTESQPGRALWTIATGTAVTVKQAEHGTIEPGGSLLGKGEPIAFTFTPEYGFRVENVLIDDKPIADTGETDGRTATYTFTPSGDSCEVSAAFVALEKEDLHEEIEKLPDFSDPSTVTDDDRNAILDAKLDYEAFIENNPDEPLDPDAIDKLHEALMQLPEIELEIVIEVAAEDGAADGVVEISKDCLHHFAYQLEQNELKALRDGSAELLKIVAVVDEGVAEPEEDESAALSAALGDDYSIGKHFNVTVTKQVFEKKDDEKPLSAEPLHSLEKGVTMTFAVPAELAAPEGTTRAYAIARTHQEDDGSWNASILADENEADPTSVTVTSDRFSRYAIVYTETAASDDPNEPTVPNDPSDDPATPDDPNDSAKPLPDPADTDDSTGDETAGIVAVGDHGAAAGVAAIGALAFAALIAARFTQRRIR